MAADREQTVLDAQPPRRHVQQRNVAAVAVREHDLPHPGAAHGRAQVHHHAHQRVGRERERAWVLQMFVRSPHGLRL